MPSTALLLLMIGLFGGIFAAIPLPTVNKLTMTKIDLDLNGDKNIKVDFTLTDASHVIDDTKFALIVGSISQPSIETEYKVESFKINDNCNADDKKICHVLFTKLFVEPSDPNLIFILEGEHPTEELTIIGGIEYVSIEEFPSTVTGQWVGKKGVGGSHGHTLRINEKVKGSRICIDGVPQPDEIRCQTKGSADKPCYAINIGGKIDVNTLSICQHTENSIPVIVKSIAKPIDADITIGTAGPVPSSIVFDYTTNTITNGVTAGNNEALVFKKGGKDGIICTTVVSCVLTGYEVEDKVNELDIVFITTDGSIATNSYEVSFQDSSLQVFALDTMVFEARWHHHDNKYIATRTIVSLGSDEPFNVVESDCTDNNGFCYAYYVKVVKGSYTVTTKPNKGDDDDDRNQIVSLQVDLPPLKSSRSIHNYTQVIHVESTVTSVTEQNTKFDVCFNYVANSSAQGMHYEFLAINSKGMWKKFLGEKKKSESHACFYALNLITADFNENSKFLVLLRDTTNGNVLNSGEAALHLQALRAIKPEVDNGNNGSTSTLAIVGVAIGGIACLMALVTAAIMFIMKIKRNNDGLQYPLHHTKIEQDSSYIHGLDNPIPTL